MAMIGDDDVARMRSELFFEGPDVRRRTSRFWMLLVLAAVIAAAGVAGDSSATVIGAMIVAPLMTPIVGIALATALNDRPNLLRCLATVMAGAGVVVAIGFLMGLVTPELVVAATNSQVASRVSPRLVDLVAALATGAVGAVALLRSDINDTLPGVAIAISLVPPLSVVGLTLESGAPDQAWGALLLFLANVSAILATAVVTMGVAGLVRARESPARSRTWTRPGLLVIGAMVLCVAVPLAATSVRLARSNTQEQKLGQVARDWAGASRWSVVSLNPDANGMTLRVIGPRPAPNTAELRSDLEHAGLGHLTVHVELVPESRVTLGPGES
jgi:uncharacterized hydrophobic protein (TIGR00271 family)